MVNNTTGGFNVIKQNIKASTTAAGGTYGATGQDHPKYFGTFVLNGATPVTVIEPNINATVSCDINISLKTVGGTVGPSPVIQTITGSTGFTVAGTAGDTSTYNYLLENHQ